MRVRPGAIVFDCDGVLVDSEAIHVVAEREVLGAYGIDVPYGDYLSRFVGMREADWMTAVEQEFLDRGMAFPGEELAGRLAPVVSERMARDLAPIPGVDSVLAAFAGPVAVASSAQPDDLRRKLRVAGLLQAFEPHIYSGAEVTRGKPAPDLFLHAAACLGVAAADCFAIEDSVNGVKSARAAGMTTIGFTGGGHADPGLGDRLVAAGADATVTSHVDLAAHLRDGTLPRQGR